MSLYRCKVLGIEVVPGGRTLRVLVQGTASERRTGKDPAVLVPGDEAQVEVDTHVPRGTVLTIMVVDA